MGVNPDSIPRYEQPMDEEASHRCGDCDYCKDVRLSQNGLTEYVSACVFEAFQADTFEQLAKADVVAVDPDDPACEDAVVRVGRLR